MDLQKVKTFSFKKTVSVSENKNQIEERNFKVKEEEIKASFRGLGDAFAEMNSGEFAKRFAIIKGTQDKNQLLKFKQDRQVVGRHLVLAA